MDKNVNKEEQEEIEKLSISKPEYGFNWENRLESFLLAERSMRRFQLVYTLSLCFFIVSAGLLVTTIHLHLIISSGLFTGLLLISLFTIVIFVFNIPLARVSKHHRNDLSRYFYQNDVNVEFSGNGIRLRNRRNSKIVMHYARN